jgi:hypothetical protein
VWCAWLRPHRFAEDKGDGGQQLALKAIPAPSRALPAEYLTLRRSGSHCCKVPAGERLSRHGSERQRHLAEHARSQGEWIRNDRQHRRMHGMSSAGNKATREIPEGSDSFESTRPTAWDPSHPVRPGGGGMSARFTAGGPSARARDVADWTDRIASGELPDGDAAAAAGQRAQRRA